MPKSSFQEIILKLQDFWASHGCLITQPYYTQVGAGTMNPNTFLRVLGPEPWNVAYVEPSVRPDDGRYGSVVIVGRIEVPAGSSKANKDK